MIVRTVFGIAAMVASAGAMAAGNLATKPTKLPELVVGLEDTGYGVSQKTYELETGKSYSLVVKSTGAKECAWESPGLFANIWLRKVEAGGMEIKAAQLKELEYENAGSSEIFFVPIVPGEFAWACRGMTDQGMAGSFIVK